MIPAVAEGKSAKHSKIVSAQPKDAQRNVRMRGLEIWTPPLPNLAQLPTYSRTTHRTAAIRHLKRIRSSIKIRR